MSDLDPFGEDCDYDLVADFEGRLHRVQVKYTESDGDVVTVRCRSHSLTKGKVRATKRFTAGMVDWIAVFDRTSDRCITAPPESSGTDEACCTFG